jgi:hypothetical protein
MESTTPVPEAAEDPRHRPDALAAGDVPMVMDEGGDTVNVQQSPPAVCSPTGFVTLISWLMATGSEK